MSRLKKFAHSLFSGYLQLVANIVFTLASVPLALAYLSKPEFGLWALTTQLATFVGLLDFGMSASVSRVLVDFKDRRDDGDYGSVIQTGVLVSAVQGAIILIGGGVLAIVLGPMLNVPSELDRDFRWLTMGQCALLAGTFAARVFSLVLAAHQRYDITNYSQAGIFFINLALMWWGFSAGLGVFSLLWAQLGSLVLSTMVNWMACVRLGLFPHKGRWGRPNRRRFQELFAFGRDIFLFVLGAQLVVSSQTILITRVLGLEAGAVWAVCTRGFQVVTQIIYRIFDYSAAAFAEMIVREERQLLLRRIKSITVMSCSLSVVAGAIFVVCNQPFVELWTRGKVGWAPVNDVLLGIWLLVEVVSHVHVGLVGQTKAFRFMRFLYFFQGLFFAGISLVLLRWGGITAMLVVSIVASLLFSFPYGIYRSSEYFRESWSGVAFGWIRPSLRLATVIFPSAVVFWWLTRTLPPVARMIICTGGLGVLGGLLLLRLGLDERLQSELCERGPMWMRGAMRYVCGRKLAASGQ